MEIMLIEVMVDDPNGSMSFRVNKLGRPWQIGRGNNIKILRWIDTHKLKAIAEKKRDCGWKRVRLVWNDQVFFGVDSEMMRANPQCNWCWIEQWTLKLKKKFPEIEECHQCKW